MRYLKFLFVLLLTNLYCSVNAQVYGFKHVIEVGYFPEWGNYLTVANNGVGYISLYYNDKCTKRDKLTTYDLIGTDRYPRIGDIIIAVDGISTKGWGPGKFYDMVDGRNDTVTLKLKTRENGGVIQEYEIKIRPKTEDLIKLRGIELVCEKVNPILDTNCKKSREEIKKKNKYELFEQRYDSKFDFFNATRYAYAINSDDPLLDRELLACLFVGSSDIDLKINGRRSTLGTMIYDEKNPDIIFTIARSANQNIATTYVPPSYRTVNTGSTTKVTSDVYPGRYWGSIYTTSKTTQHGYTVKDGDYTVTTRTSDVYLQVTALDAKKINDPKQTAPPIVWETVCKKHIVNGSETPTEVMKHMIFDMEFPIDNYNDVNTPMFCDDNLYVKGPVGIIVDPSDPHRVKDVIPYSLADAAGFRPGDRLVFYRPLFSYNDRKWKKYWKIMDKVVEEQGWYGTFYPFYFNDKYHYFSHSTDYLYDKERDRLRDNYRGEKNKYTDEMIRLLASYGVFHVVHEDGSDDYIFLEKANIFLEKARSLNFWNKLL